MTLKCRLCLQDNSTITSVSDYDEGLPISVIIMIICPVTITTEDKLPKFICEECLEVIISAYKLRTISHKNEQFLLSHSLEQNLQFKSALNRKYNRQIIKDKQPKAIMKDFSSTENSNQSSSCKTGPFNNFINENSTSSVNNPKTMQIVVVGKKSRNARRTSAWATNAAICSFCNLKCANKYIMLRHIRRKHIIEENTINEHKVDDKPKTMQKVVVKEKSM